MFCFANGYMQISNSEPEEILTKEALSMPNRTVVVAGRETDEGQMDTLLKALKQKLKEGLLGKPVEASRTI